jgi:hypothetical protein
VPQQLGGRPQPPQRAAPYQRAKQPAALATLTAAAIAGSSQSHAHSQHLPQPQPAARGLGGGGGGGLVGGGLGGGLCGGGGLGLMAPPPKPYDSGGLAAKRSRCGGPSTGTAASARLPPGRPPLPSGGPLLSSNCGAAGGAASGGAAGGAGVKGPWPVALGAHGLLPLVSNHAAGALLAGPTRRALPTGVGGAAALLVLPAAVDAPQAAARPRVFGGASSGLDE